MMLSRRQLMPLIGLALGGATAAVSQEIQYAQIGPAAPVVRPRVAGNTFEFVRNEFGSNSMVKGAPYTAEAVTESVQTLADGNRIEHRDSTTLARDSEGRTRRDVSMPVLPGMSADESPKFSFIFDPVSNTSITLDHRARTATKGSGAVFTARVLNKMEGGPASVAGAAPMREQGNVVYRRATGMGVAVAAAPGNVASENAASGNAAPAGIVSAAPATGDPTGRFLVLSDQAGPARSPDAVTTSLGKQNIEGVMAEGTRTVTTIPTGQIGNQRPIEIVSERWYSPELQMVVLSKFSDPRSGETTYRVSNLRRSEPAKSLFEVPSDYTLTERPPMPELFKDK